MSEQQNKVWGVFVGERGYQLEAFNSQKGPFPPEPGTEGYIAIGWPALGDMRLYDGDYVDYVSKFRKVYGDKNERVLVTKANMVWNFAFLMKEDDWVICPSSATGYLLVGKIVGNYIPDFHNESGMYKNTSEVYLHLRKVRWLYVISKKDVRYSKLNKIGRLTVTQTDISIDELKSILNSNLAHDATLTQNEEAMKENLKNDELKLPVTNDHVDQDDQDDFLEYRLTESGDLDDDSNPYEN